MHRQQALQQGAAAWVTPSRPSRSTPCVCAYKERAAGRSGVRRPPFREQLGPVDPEALARAQTADAAFQVHTVQWYPGHIARAERQLKEQLKMVDLVLEVRDARIPQSTCHPQVRG